MFDRHVFFECCVGTAMVDWELKITLLHLHLLLTDTASTGERSVTNQPSVSGEWRVAVEGGSGGER